MFNKFNNLNYKNKTKMFYNKLLFISDLFKNKTYKS